MARKKEEPLWFDVYARPFHGFGTETCDGYTKEDALCRASPTQVVSIVYPGTQIYTALLCDKHAQILSSASDILGLLIDLHNEKESNRKGDAQREARFEHWLNVFLSRSQPNDSAINAELLAKRAYEFAHAMIGREQYYRRLLSGRHMSKSGDYFHPYDLLKKASEEGKW